ncbi:MAG: leucine-rich repeat domain-containing protein [Pseudomonadota bacterium]
MAEHAYTEEQRQAAYNHARERIADANARAAKELDLGAGRFSGDRGLTGALSALPPEIGTLAGLKVLDLRNTRISDLAPLAGLRGLEMLYLNDTLVADLAPLANLSGLQGLDLTGTQVSDLAPLRSLGTLKALSFKDSPAAQADDVFSALSRKGGEACAMETIWYLNGRHPEFNGRAAPVSGGTEITLPDVVSPEWQSDDADNPVLRGASPAASSGRVSLNLERQAALMVAAAEAAELLLEQARRNQTHPDVWRYLERYRDAVGRDLHAFIPNTPNLLVAMIGGAIDDNRDTPRVVADGFAAFQQTHRQMMKHFPAEEDLEDAAEAIEIDLDAVQDLPQEVTAALTEKAEMFGAEILQIVEGNAARIEVLNRSLTHEAARRRKISMLAIMSVAAAVLGVAADVTTIGVALGWNAAKIAWAAEQISPVVELLRPIVEKLRQMWPNIRFPD